MSSSGGPKVPGLNVLDNVVRAYQRAWSGQLDAASTFWQDVTSSKASVGTFVQSGAKFVDNWYKTVTEFFVPYAGALQGGAATTRIVTFAIDPQAQSGNDQTFVVPFGVRPGAVQATAPTAVGPAPPAGRPPRRGQAAAGPAANVPKLTVAVADAGSVTLTLEFTSGANRPTGTFLSVLYDSDKPQAVAGVGIVIITFTP